MYRGIYEIEFEIDKDSCSIEDLAQRLNQYMAAKKIITFLHYSKTI